MTSWKARKRKIRRKRVSNVMIFLLLFIFFLLIFGGLCLWAVFKINEERVNAVSSSNSTSINEESTFTAKDARNLLIVTLDGGKAQGFVVVRMDPANTRISALAIPRDTVVDVETKEMRLYELFDSKGINDTKKALEKLLSITYDNYAIITYANVGKIIDYFDSNLIFNLDEDLEYIDGDTFKKLGSGLRTLDSSQVLGVLRYSSWKSGRKQSADIHAKITAALINQYLRVSRKAKANTDFSAIVNLARTDILVSHYNAVKPGLSHLADQNQGSSICTSISLGGEYKGNGEAIRFYVSNDIIEKLSSIFGQST